MNPANAENYLAKKNHIDLIKISTEDKFSDSNLNKIKIFLSESGIKYGVGKFPAKLSHLIQHISTDEKESESFSTGVTSLSFIEHFSGIIQYVLRSKSFYKNYKQQSNHLKLQMEMQEYLKKIKSEICILRLKNTLLINHEKISFRRKATESSMDFHSKKIKIKSELLNQKITKLYKTKEKIDQILSILHNPYYNAEEYRKKIKQSAFDLFQSIAYVINYGLKLIKDILKFVSLHAAKSTKVFIHFFSQIISSIVYPVSLLFALYKTHQDAKSIATTSALCKKLDNFSHCNELKRHMISKKHKSIASMLGNLLSALGYIFASASAFCSLIIPGTVAVATMITPAGWAFAGAGAFVLLALLVYRLAKYWQQHRVKQLCLAVLNHQPESQKLFRTRYNLENASDNEVRKYAKRLLCKVSARYAVIHFVARIRKKHATQEWKGSQHCHFLKTMITRKSERKTFLNQDYKDQVWLLCEKLKIKTVVKTPLQYHVFEKIA